MENKTELNCSYCNQKIRIPSAKHLNVTCPSCNKHFEIDGRPIQNNKFKYKWIFIGVLIGLIISGYRYFNYIKANETLVNSNVQVEPQQNTSDSPENNEFDNNLNTLVSAVDISNEITNDFAVRLASKFPGKYNIGQICQIYDYLVKNWKYVNDSDKMENFRSASRTIKNDFAGDCDDFAILIAAMIESIGGDTRISLAYNDEGGHAFTEVLASENKENMQSIVDEINELYGTDQFKINYWIDEAGKCWLNLDWFGSPQHPGGQYFDYKKRTIYYPTIVNPTYEQESKE